MPLVVLHPGSIRCHECGLRAVVTCDYAHADRICRKPCCADHSIGIGDADYCTEHCL